MKTPLQNEPPVPAAAHGCRADTKHDLELPETDLLSPLTIRGLTLRNRIGMSPMCQYCAQEASGSRRVEWI